ncbi:hypothetical protein B0H16DRAFT_1518667 [Mycena metata]|uniref:Uncharacterized protein n=1 Tax=Mycena metata TaxID=1033252 RepID=A0AAD7JP14_9AGAR|nr:hypothetical protein B0H16DRAFT_1518667 [Mycena metata]
MARLTPELGAAVVFLILYFFVFVWLVFAYATHRLKWRSRWTMLLAHVTIRLAAQGCGIGFAILVFKNIGLFAAFLVLGAEGYFSLVLCTFRFLISWHEHNLPSGTSWLEPRRPPRGRSDRRTELRRRLTFLLLGPFGVLIYPSSIMLGFDSLLLLANVVIVLGGSYLTQTLGQGNTSAALNAMKVSRIMRTAGQSVFVACNMMLLVFLLMTAHNDRRTGARKRALGVHPTLILLMLAWIPLIIRGAFGVLQSADFELSYYNPANYGLNGFSVHYTVVEYLLGVTPEWIAVVLLSCTYFTSKNDPPKPPVNPGRGETEIALVENNYKSSSQREREPYTTV